MYKSAKAEAKEETLNLTEYGFTPDMLTENASGILARITAVNKERYALVCEHEKATNG